MRFSLLGRKHLKRFGKTLPGTLARRANYFKEVAEWKDLIQREELRFSLQLIICNCLDAVFRSRIAGRRVHSRIGARKILTEAAESKALVRLRRLRPCARVLVCYCLDCFSLRRIPECTRGLSWIQPSVQRLRGLVPLRSARLRVTP